MATVIQFPQSSRSAYDLTRAEREDAKGLLDAYHVVMLLSNRPDISALGLEIAVRVQKHLCDEYNRILLKGWRPS